MVRALHIAAVALVTASVSARPELAAKIPNGMAHEDAGSGLTCDAFGHLDCVPGGPRNAFGLDFKAAGFEWTKELCEKDSDGDSVSNGRELGDPCCLWTPENPNPKGFRVDKLSHPGLESDDGAKDTPTCDEASAGAAEPDEAAAVTEPAAKAPEPEPEARAPATEAPVVEPVVGEKEPSEDLSELPLCPKVTSEVYTPYPRTDATKDKLLLLKVDAGSKVDPAQAKVLEDGEYICPGDYPTPWSIVCDVPYKPEGSAIFDVDGAYYRAEGALPFAIAGDKSGGVITEWKLESTGPVTIRCYTSVEGDEVSANVTIGCEGDATAPSATTAAPKTETAPSDYACVPDGEFCAGKKCCTANARCEKVDGDGKRGEVCNTNY